MACALTTGRSWPTVGAGLLAMRVCQVSILRLTHCNREQARSHKKRASDPTALKPPQRQLQAPQVTPASERITSSASVPCANLNPAISSQAKTAARLSHNCACVGLLLSSLCAGSSTSAGAPWALATSSTAKRMKRRRTSRSVGQCVFCLPKAGTHLQETSEAIADRRVFQATTCKIGHFLRENRKRRTA